MIITNLGYGKCFNVTVTINFGTLSLINYMDGWL